MIVRAKYITPPPYDDRSRVIAMDDHGRTFTAGMNGTFRMEADMDHTIPGFLAGGGAIEPFDGSDSLRGQPAFQAIY